MKVKMLKTWFRKKAGQVCEVADGVGKTLIKQGKAEKYVDKRRKPKAGDGADKRTSDTSGS